jgi:hypothetical protein
MTRPMLLAFRDLIDDVAYHGTNVVQGAFDLLCLAALGACLYVASLNDESPFRPLASTAQTSVLPAGTTSPCQALPTAAQPVPAGCITAQVLDASIGT